MKKNIFCINKILALAIIVLFVFGLYGDSVYADTNGTAYTIYASQINAMEDYNLPIGNINLILDEDCELNSIYLSKNKQYYNIKISGNHTLTVNGSIDVGKLIVSCKKMIVKSAIFAYIFNVEADASLEISSNGDVGILVKDDLVSYGNISIKSPTMCIKANRNVFLKGGSYNFEATDHGIYAKNIVISDSTVYIKSNALAFNADSYLDITNSYVDSIVIEKERNVVNMIAYNGIRLKNCSVEIPQNTNFKSGDICILKKEGGNPDRIVISNKSTSEKGAENTANNSSTKAEYKNEWINGKWYDSNGNQTYSGTLNWKSNGTGWWVEDSVGWYPQDSWQKIDGIWYYFKPDGYMAASEYCLGYWFNGDGSWDNQYYLSWKSNSTGWWVEDKSGWWPSSKWLKIDGSWYYFDALGYMVTNQYVDGYWIGANGVCQ